MSLREQHWNFMLHEYQLMIQKKQTTKDITSIKKWAKNLRNRANTLSSTQIDMLNNINFPFKINNSFKNNLNEALEGVTNNRNKRWVTESKKRLLDASVESCGQLSAGSIASLKENFTELFEEKILVTVIQDEGLGKQKQSDISVQDAFSSSGPRTLQITHKLLPTIQVIKPEYVGEMTRNVVQLEIPSERKVIANDELHNVSPPNAIHVLHVSKISDVIVQSVAATASLKTPLSTEDVSYLNYCIGTDNTEDRENTTANIAVSRIGVQILSYNDFRKLRDQIWLNDEIINWFMYILTNNDISLCVSNPSKRHTHYFSSFLVHKLLVDEGGYCHDKVKRWSKKVYGQNIFDLESLFFPINIGNVHWVSVIVHIQRKVIEFYDSSGGSYAQYYIQGIFRYLQDEDRCHHGGLALGSHDLWKLRDCSDCCPKQSNNNDCGMFTCAYAYHYSCNLPFQFDNGYVTEMRQRLGRLVLSMRTTDFYTRIDSRNVARMSLLKN